MEIIKETEYYKLSYEEENKLIVWQPKCKMNSDTFRDGFIQGMAKLEELYAKGIIVRWLNKVEEQKVTGISDLKWLNTSINNVGIKCECDKVAFTKANDIFGKTSIQFYAKYTTTDKLKVKYFETEELAREWLKS